MGLLLAGCGPGGIPGPSEAATVDPRHILFDEDQYLLTEEHLIRAEYDRPTDPSTGGLATHIHLGVKHGHYGRLLQRIASSNMITFLEPASPVIENSFFGVWKVVGKIQRVIWGGNRANPLFRREASAVELPTPDLLAGLELPVGKSLHFASCNVSQHYNRLRAPKFLIPFLDLPRIRASHLGLASKSGYLVPRLQCIPMGATFAVALAQKLSIAIIHRSGLGRNLFHMSRDNAICASHGTIVLYLDDFSAVGTDRHGVNRGIDRIEQTLQRYNLPPAANKRQYAHGAPNEGLGMWWWPSGVLTV